jgi:hypothetical protein
MFCLRQPAPQENSMSKGPLTWHAKSIYPWIVQQRGGHVQAALATAAESGE